MRILFYLMVWMVPLGAFAEEEQPFKMLPVEERVEGDYFTWGKGVEILGTVTGDVYVMGGQVFIDGVVEGSVLVLAGTAEVSGHVKQNVRGMGGQLRISGRVDHNVTLVAANAEVTQTARIGGDIVSVAGNTDLGGSIGFNATLVSSNLRLSGEVKNDVRAYSEQVRIGARSHIDGNLTYRSSVPAWIDPNARILGKVTYHPTLVHDLFKGTWLQGVLIGSKFAALFMNFIFTFVIGVIVLKIFPASAHSAVLALKHHAAKAVIYGVVLLVIFPLAALLLMMTILGAPFALTILALNVVTFYTVKLFPVLWVGNWLFPKVGLKAWHLPGFTLGLIAYFFLTMIPYFGQGLSFAALLFGLGAMVISQGKHLHLPLYRTRLKSSL